MPGVQIRTATRSGPVNPAAPDSGRYLVVGQFERGNTTGPTLVRSAAELEVEFGDRVPYSAAWDDLRMFFEEGGAEAQVIRVVGPDATIGTLNLTDSANAPTLRVDAKNAGAWSGNLTVAVEAGYQPDSVRVVVRLGDIVEKFESLTSSVQAADVITARSKLVNVTDLGAGTLPAVITATALSAGVDDRAAITAATMTGALDRLDTDLGTGAVAIPGYPAEQVGAALMAHAKANRRIALLATGIGATEQAATLAADRFVGVDGEHGGLFYPWVKVPLGGGVTKLVSPEGYVAAARARAHRERGPWQAAAGALAVARYVLEPERPITAAEGDRLNEAHVNAIRTIQGTTRLYGWRSLSSDLDNYALLTGRDTVNTVAALCEFRLEPYLFHSVDARGHLLSQVKASLVGILEPYRVAGGLYEDIDQATGAQIDPGYSVDVGPTVNTSAVLSQNKIAAQIALRVSPVGELIEVTIVKASLTSTV